MSQHSHAQKLPRSALHPRRGAGIGLGAALGIGFLLLLLVIGGVFASSYNGLVSRQEAVDQSWAEVENQYKRRYDLIPNLVETVKGVAEFEQSTMTAVTEARASVGRVQLPSGLPTDQAQLDAYIAAQQSLGGALGRLFAVSENYPQLRASQSFLSLQDQLEGTENRIAVARNDYTRSVQDFNTNVRTFPRNLVAGMFGFEKLPQFSVPEEETAVPKVGF
jgi:LemA protein